MAVETVLSPVEDRSARTTSPSACYRMRVVVIVVVSVAVGEVSCVSGLRMCCDGYCQ